ncbi:MAG: stage III sporulation protein AC [Thermaerobacter sp.]|nr:stage III sporulation protein AC [Thermaerobacter sp.]
MVNIDLILRLAGIGFVVAIAYEILDRVNRKELGNLVAVGGVAVMLLMVVQVIGQLFKTVLTLFHL